MPQAKDHIVKSFDEEIRKLNNLITYMGGLAESQLQAAIEALLKRDAEAASRIIHDDAKIDEQENLISQQVVRLLALRQPMAIDLRQIVAALKISSDLERFGDYATNIAKRSIALSQLPPLKPLFAIPRMSGWLAHWQELLNDPAQKISRPRQWYAGPDERAYVPLANR